MGESMADNFKDIVQRHALRYPLMQPRDYGKLAYQSEFGPEHLVADEETMLHRLLDEWEQVKEIPTPPPEDIGGGLCRVHLGAQREKTYAAQLIVKLFSLTSWEHTGSRKGLEDKLAVLEKLPVAGMREWLCSYRAEGCPPVRHSEMFREHYAPHYRLMKREYVCALPALLEVAKLLHTRESVVVAIDGRCGSGKTSLAALMEQVFDCNIFHMDDFYLPKPDRAENWLEIPGGNMDLARLRREVLDRVFSGETVDYRPFDCSAGAQMPPIPIKPKNLTVLEGSYSHHPELAAPYDLKIFVTCEKQEQLRRLQVREGDYFPTFMKLWMPLEEQYIRAFDIGSDALAIDTGLTFDESKFNITGGT